MTEKGPSKIRERRYLDYRLVDYPGMHDLKRSDLEAGKVFSTGYLLGYISYLLNFHQMTRTSITSTRSIRRGTLHELASNWGLFLRTLGKEDVLPTEGGFAFSRKVTSHKDIAQRLGLKDAVLFTGKLEGVKNHLAAVRYLWGWQPEIILGIEPETYFSWEKKALNPNARGFPLFPDEVKVSLWAHHYLVSGVFLIPEANYSSLEGMNEFYDRLFEETGAAYTCAVEGDPFLKQRLNRGKIPPEIEVGFGDWRIIPRFRYPTTSETVEIVR